MKNQCEKKPKTEQNQPKKHPGGRPPRDWTELRKNLCKLISTSNKSLNTCLAELKTTLGYTADITTVFDWIHDDPEFAKQYARAKEEQADFLIEEMLEIADDSSEDDIFIEKNDESGKSAKRVCNNEFVQRSRLRVDTRKWLASKLKPKRYGDRLDLSTDTGPIQFNLRVIYDDKPQKNGD